jgi:hypothetical protein
MSSRTMSFRFAFLALVLLVLLQPASGWALQNWSVSPTGPELAPGTPVTAGYSIHFDSWMTGSTFDKDNSLVMVTDLVNPRWQVTKVEAMDNQAPIVEQVPVSQGSQVKIDGWTLSYVRKQFDIVVQVSGKTPSPAESATISVIRLQEMAPGAKAVTGSLTKKEMQIIVPTPEPTATATPITINMTPAEIIEVTPEQKAPETANTPAKKVTYTPGPEPVAVAGLLAALVLVRRVGGRKG